MVILRTVLVIGLGTFHSVLVETFKIASRVYGEVYILYLR